MLTKIAPASNDFHALARYLVRGTPGSTPHPDRVAWTFTQNLPTDDPELAATYMRATARLSQRTRKAAYHLMIAWHERERPNAELMQTIARRTLELAGLAEHQALIMGHGDKPHRHLHILLNRVHPDTGRAWKTSQDFARFDRIMRLLSEEYGCEYTPAHAFNPDITDAIPKKPNSCATYAARHGASTTRLQWSRKSAREFGEQLSEELTPASTMEDLDMAIADYGLAIEQKGSGLVVGDGVSYAKFSSLGLKLSAKGHPRTFRSMRDFSDRPIFSVDEIDIVRAFMTLGLADRDDLLKAIRQKNAERISRRARADASASKHILRAAMSGTTLDKPKVSQSAYTKSVPVSAWRNPRIRSSGRS